MNNIFKMSRREAFLALGGVMLSASARAQDVTPAVPRFNPFQPVDAALAAGLTAPALGQVDKTKSYFIFFQKNVDTFTMKSLRGYLVGLVEGGVTDITLVISSPGGLVIPALQMYGLIRSLPVTIKTHGQGFVQSAANILMLAGEGRTADVETQFWFHPAQSPIFGTFNTPQFEDQLQMLNETEDTMAQIYGERTKIPSDEIKRFKHETMIYGAAKAQEYGIIQSVGTLQPPGNQKSKFLFLD
jgi:ATP-dependent Clp protease, protease subunit